MWVNTLMVCMISLAVSITTGILFARQMDKWEEKNGRNNKKNN